MIQISFEQNIVDIFIKALTTKVLQGYLEFRSTMFVNYNKRETYWVYALVYCIHIDYSLTVNSTLFYLIKSFSPSGSLLKFVS